MSPATKSPEVVVVGAGPVGLSVAMGLARAGRSVWVLEKEATTADHSRAPAIWPRTQEVLAELGVIDDFLARGLTVRDVRLRDADSGGELLSIPLDELEDETPFPQLLILPQSETERLLCERVRRSGWARVLFSAEVTGVEADASGVTVAYRHEGELETVRAAFAVGCDGAHSTVRESLGIPFEGETYRTRAALADLRPRSSQDVPFPRLSTRAALVVGIRIDAHLWRLILPLTASDDEPLDRRVEHAAIHLFPGIRSPEDYELVWQSEFRLHRRIASRFVHGRVALAGDAAHLNSPVGGQGMNAGIQDAASLTTILLRALQADDAAPLADYERRRRPEVERGVNAFTDRLTRLLLFGRGRAIRAVLSLARLALRIAPLRRRFLRRIAMLRDP